MIISYQLIYDLINTAKVMGFQNCIHFSLKFTSRVTANKWLMTEFLGHMFKQQFLRFNPYQISLEWIIMTFWMDHNDC